ncbi:MAG: TlpA family protein disulfide reductase [Nitrospinae bacterium]|nr:TlpA family protein disulfide reductase [Nitrospinota bacterium]
MTLVFARNLLSAMLAVFVFAAASCQTNEMEPPPPEKPRPAPSFSMTSVKGKQVSLASLAGKPAMINFWATWCAPCVKELPELERIHNLYKERGLEVILFNLQEKADVVKKHIEEHGYTMTSMLDEKGEMAEKYQVFGLPTTFFVDKAGMIRKTHMGELTKEIITEGLSAIEAH